MAYQQRAAQLFWRAVEDPDFLQSVRSHQRYPLRLVAIISAAFGLFFNLLTVCLGQHKALNGIAFIPLFISLLWHHADLLSTRISKQGLPLPLLAWVDLLGFVAFLILLIVNGILASNLYGYSNIVVLMTYTSVPWMFLCAIHGFVVAQIALPYPLGNLQVNAVCPDCHRDWKGQHTQSGHTRDGATYALLSEDDVESHAGTSIRMNDGDATPRTQRQTNEAQES